MFYNSHIEKRFMRPTWAEVSLSALQHNFRTLQDHVGPHAIVCAVVKADAYGHGSVECARALQQVGCEWFGVSSPDLEDAAHKCYGGRLRSPRVPVHLKIDTGMGRLGLCTGEIGAFATTIKAAEYVFLEGLFTHLASAEVTGAPDTDAQIGRFEDAVSAIIENGLSPTYYHMANSAAIAGRQNTWRNMVRPGISLYGYYLPFTSAISGSPDPSVELQVKPVLTWKTRIHAIRDFPAKSPIGYNAAYITSAPARIAVLPVGYADGLSRQLSSQGRVIVRNDYAPIVGIVSMDMTMIDVTGIPGADIGDEVILLGSNGERSISAWEHANLAHTIPYETLCNISKRVPRKYVE